MLRNVGNPLIWERRLAKRFPGIDEQQECELCAAIHTRFFALTPAGKDCFKQSNTYLHVTADKVLDVTITFFRVPLAPGPRGQGHAADHHRGLDDRDGGHRHV